MNKKGSVSMQCDFSIVFICAGGYEYFHKILENNIRTLCEDTHEKYDLVLFLDGIENYDYTPYLELGPKYGFDEIRLRSREHHCATGDCSNNSHMQIFSDKTKYLLTFESDVAIFKLDKCFDVLRAVRIAFEKNPSLCIATRMDDYSCWKEKLMFLPQQFTDDIQSVNRVSSHFLAYDTRRCRKWFAAKGCFRLDCFYDNEHDWYNYEDMIGTNFAYPNGPGIGFFRDLPIKVYHCDEKIKEGSAFYKRDLQTRLRVFEQRKAECIRLASEMER